MYVHRIKYRVSVRVIYRYENDKCISILNFGSHVDEAKYFTLISSC